MAAGDYVCEVVQRGYCKRLEIGLELFRRPDLGWNVAMTISPRSEEIGLECSKNAGLECRTGMEWGWGWGADGLKCSIRVHNNLRRVALQHFFSQSRPWVWESSFRAHGGIDLRGCRSMINRPGRL